MRANDNEPDIASDPPLRMRRGLLVCASELPKEFQDTAVVLERLRKWRILELAGDDSHALKI